MEKLKKFFHFRPPGFEWAPAYSDYLKAQKLGIEIAGSWDGWINMLRRGQVGTGLLIAEKPKLAKIYRLEIDDRRIPVRFRPEAEWLKSERDFQNGILQAVIRNSKTGGIIIAATGAGKTYTAAMVFHALIGTGLFIVDELTLMEQSREELERIMGEKIGFIGRGKFLPERITVSTIQSLHKHISDKHFRKWYKNLQLAIIDEFHVAINKRNIDVVNKIRPLCVVGMSATIEIEKPEVILPMIDMAGPVIYTYTIQQGTEDEILTRGGVCSVKVRTNPKVEGYWTVANVEGKKMKQYVSESTRAAEYRSIIVLNKLRNDAIEALVREGVKRGHHVMVLVDWILHLKILSKRFPDIVHRVMSGNSALSGNSQMRIQAMKDMDAGKLPLIFANKVFGKGVNVRTLDVIIDGTGRPNRNAAKQRYGRGVRTAENKARLLYFNIYDIGNSFQYVSETREQSLYETGAEMDSIIWNGDAAAAYDLLE